MMKRLVSFDWAVKKLLRSKANYGILEGFLSELLKEDIIIKQFLDTESNKEEEFGKFNRVDVLVENSKGEIIIIEIQNNYELDYMQRMFNGSSNILIEYIKEGSPYSEIKKIISVNIVYFDLGQGEDYIYHGKTKFIGMNKNDELQLSEKQKNVFKVDSIDRIYPEYYVIKMNQFDDVAKNTLDEWIYFLKNEEINDDFNAKGLVEAKTKLDIMKLPKEQQAIYKRRSDDLHYGASMWLSTYVSGKMDGEKIGMEIGEKIGLEKAIAQRNFEIVRNMLEKGMETKLISEITGLQVEEIEKLINLI